MRVSYIILPFIALSISASAFSQNVSVSGKALSLPQVFETIRQQTGYNFIYDVDEVKQIKNVNLHLVNATITEVMDDCLRGLNLTYSIVNNTIVVTGKPDPGAVAQPSLQAEPPGSGAADIHGIVLYSNSVPLTSATVAVKGTKRIVQTGSNGGFDLKDVGIDAHDVELEISYIGFQTQTRLVRRGESDGPRPDGAFHRPARTRIAVVAYGTTTHRYDVGSVATVTSKDIEKQPVNNPLEALAGQVAGLQIIAPSGAPGSMVVAQIRGQNTLSGTMSQGIHPPGRLQPAAVYHRRHSLCSPEQRYIRGKGQSVGRRYGRPFQ